MSIGPAFIAILVVLAGIGEAVTGSGFPDAVVNGVVPSPESFVADAGWIVVAFLGHGHRCIGCETQQ